MILKILAEEVISNATFSIKSILNSKFSDVVCDCIPVWNKEDTDEYEKYLHADTQL